MVKILKIDPVRATHKDLRPVVDLLASGGVVAGPTETFYGLMASAENPDALDRIMAMKGRDNRKPLLLLIDRKERVGCYAGEMSESARRLAQTFWPGPLTLLLKAQPGLHESLVGPTSTVGMRVVGLPAIRLLVRSLDRAVTGTSANPGGAPPPKTAEQVREYFGDDLDMIMDGGPCPGGEPSTLIDASIGRPRLVRLGTLGMDAMLAVVPDMRT